MAQKAALYVLNDVQRTHPRYNNYSGNLNRSYVATVDSGGNSYTFMTDPTSVPKPQLTRNEYEYGKKQFMGTYDQLGRPKYGRKKYRFYYLTVRRHKKTNSYALGGKRHEWNTKWMRMKKEWEPNGMHQYSGNERAPFGSGKTMIKRGAYKGKKSKNSFFMQISNRTPYAESVEKAGYMVINIRKQLMYQKKIAKMIGDGVSVSLDHLTKEYKRDTRGRFTK